MTGSVLRRFRIATATAFLVGMVAATPANAMVPPIESGSYSLCSSPKPAGYVPVGFVLGTQNYVFDGRLTWDLCVVRTSSGAHYALARLSAPADLVNQFDRFTGTVYVYLQKCVSGVYTTVATKWWSQGSYSYATKIGGRYYFPWLQTPSTTSTATYYRVKTSGYGAVVPRSGGWYFSLAASTYPSMPAGTLPGVTTSSCMNP